MKKHVMVAVHFGSSSQVQAFAFCVVLFLVVHLLATTSVRSDAAPWMVSSRQCRMGPDLERSTATSSDVTEEGKTTFRASAGSLEEDTRRSVTRQGAQSRGSDGSFWTMRLCHESRARGGSEACEGASQCSGQDGSRRSKPSLAKPTLAKIKVLDV